MDSFVVPRAFDDRPGSYRWWYFDATSDDGETTLVVIFFVGSVFSPWYSARVARGEPARPSQHPAVNVAITRRGRTTYWAFTEYPADACRVRDTGDVRIGDSSMVALQGTWTLSLDERSPWTRERLVGTVRFVAPHANRVEPVALDSARHHTWCPIAPRARVTVDLSACAFVGDGYHDMNEGDVPLARSFSQWTWCRVHDGARTRVAYDRTEIGGARRVLTLDADVHQCHVSDRNASRAVPPLPGAWGLRAPRAFEIDGEPVGRMARVESSPFYARYVGVTRRAVAEHLDLTRFDTRWMRALLPFRARRVG